MTVRQNTISGQATGNYYFNDYITTTLYVKISFGFAASKLSLINDSDTDSVQVSFDGATLHYTLAGGEYKDIPCSGAIEVYVKATTGGEKCRISAV